MTLLTPHEVEQLVALRISLEDAQLRGKSATKHRRGTAIVALDATVERASSLVAITRGVPVPTNLKLDDLISRLVQDMGQLWKPTVLPDIRHLRRARNAAQHEGLEPDREQLPLWAGAADAYVSSLIEAQFAVDIHRVILADAIQGSDLRRLMKGAEEARAGGDYAASVDAAKKAYVEASNKWNQLRRGNVPGFPPMHGDVLDRKSYDFLKARLSNMQAVLQAAAFSTDLAEAEWFTGTIAERSDVLTADDADRVLAFSFEWVIGYERAAETWVPNRRFRAAVERRMVRQEDIPTSIHECLGVELQHNDSVLVTFRLSDVPEEENYALWAQTLLEQLPKQQVSEWWRVLDDGTVEVHRSLDSGMSFSSDVVTLADALTATHSAVARHRRMELEKAQTAQRRRDEHAEMVKGIRKDLPDWVVNLEWSEDGMPGSTEELLLTVDKETSGLKFGQGSGRGLFDSRESLIDIIRGHELVEHCYWARGPHQLGILPVLDAEESKTVFRDVDAVVSQHLEAAQKQERQRQEAVRAARAGIAGKLAELSSPGRS